MKPGMCNERESRAPASQSDKFKEAARAAECDEDEARWDEALRKVVRVTSSGEGSASASPPSAEDP
jgi:hypothetical protein